jgi:hypothetical protein
MGHHAADGALALVLACVVPDLGRNDFFTSGCVRVRTAETEALPHLPYPLEVRMHGVESR